VARTATTTATMTTAGAAPTRATRRFSDLQRVHQRIKALAEQQLQMLEQRMAQLQAMKTLLSDMISQCAGNDDPHCVILDKLASDDKEVHCHD